VDKAKRKRNAVVPSILKKVSTRQAKSFSHSTLTFFEILTWKASLKTSQFGPLCLDLKKRPIRDLLSYFVPHIRLKNSTVFKLINLLEPE
jgi:hypothetical protein